MFRFHRSALTAALILSWACATATAQTPAKPAPAKPALPATSESGGKTLDGSAPSSSSKVMGINELRECLKRQDELKARGAELEQRRAGLDQDRAKIEQETAAIKSQKDEISKRNDEVKAFNQRMKDYGAQVTSWNERMAELKDATGMAADRKRRELNAEQAALMKTEAANKVEGDKLMGDLEQAVKQVNDRAAAQQQSTVDWNSRNTKFNGDAQAYEDGRVEWREQCGNRRYREDDEKALRSSK